MTENFLYTEITPRPEHHMVCKNSSVQTPIGPMLEQAIEMALSLDRLNERFNNHLEMEDYLPASYEETADAIGNALMNCYSQSKAAVETLSQYSDHEKYGLTVVYVMHMLKQVQKRVEYDSDFCR